MIPPEQRPELWKFLHRVVLNSDSFLEGILSPFRSASPCAKLHLSPFGQFWLFMNNMHSLCLFNGQHPFPFPSHSCCILSNGIILALVKVSAKFYRELQKMPANFFSKTWKIQRSCMETFCRIIMQLSLFVLKLKHFHFFTSAITLFSRVSFSSNYLM